MFANISFIFFFLLLLIAIIGYGKIFSNIFYPAFLTLNFGFQGFIGIFTLTLIAMLSSFFFKHNFLFNSIMVLIGLIGFFYKVDKVYLKKNIKSLSIITVLLIIGLYPPQPGSEPIIKLKSI